MVCQQICCYLIFQNFSSKYCESKILKFPHCEPMPKTSKWFILQKEIKFSKWGKLNAVFPCYWLIFPFTKHTQNEKRVFQPKLTYWFFFSMKGKNALTKKNNKKKLFCKHLCKFFFWRFCWLRKMKILDKFLFCMLKERNRNS